MNSTGTPVIGWMVCIEGPDKGVDFNLVNAPAGNGIGANENMAVVIRGDKDVLDENHGIIRFDENCQKCFIVPGHGKRIIRLNNQVVFGPMYLKPYDRISIGASEYIFMPYGGIIDPNTTWVRVKNKQPSLDVLTDLGSCVVKPCVGWLVERNIEYSGVAHRLSADYNYIGRGNSMDVSIPADTTMQEENQAAVVYDSRENTFFFVPLAVNNGYYINGMPVNGVVPLNGFEEISVGMTRFCFVPLCGDYFRW